MSTISRDRVVSRERAASHERDRDRAGSRAETMPPVYAPRVILAEDDAVPPSLLTRAVRALPEGTGRAAAAGMEAAVLAWLCAVVPAVAAYVATAALPALGEATWMQAAGVGTVLWRLAHGATVDLAGTTLSVAPLGLTLVASALVSFSLRRAQVLTWTGIGAATAGYVVAAAVLGLIGPPGARGPAGVVAGAVLIGAAGALAGAWRGRRTLPPVTGRAADWLARLPGGVVRAAREGVRTAGLLLAGLLAAAAALTVASIAANHTAFSARLAELKIDGISTAMLMLACALLLPTLVVWALAWLAGPGFVVGTGTLYAPGDVVSGPTPVLPVLAGLPGAGTPAADLAWAPLGVVALGAVAGWLLHRRLSGREPAAGLLLSAASAVVAVAGVAAATWLLVAAASGAVGPGAMSEVGADPADVAGAVALEAGAGMLAVVVLAHPVVVAWARGLARRGRERLESGRGGSGRGGSGERGSGRTGSGTRLRTGVGRLPGVSRREG